MSLLNELFRTGALRPLDHALAHQRYARFLESGQSVPWEEVREYLKARLAGAASKRPRPRKLDR